MVITGLALQNFRLHKNLFIKFEHQTTVIVGENAIGKTSIVEALHLLATGNSFRAGKVEEMILFDEELARVKGVIFEKKENQDLAQTDEVEVILTKGFVNGKKSQHRLFNVNGVRRRKKTAAGKFASVVFRPEDMRLIEGSPSRRRSFLDSVLASLYIDYEISLKNYEQTLRRRNKILQQIREGKQPQTVLKYWDLNLVKYGTVLQNYRQRFIETFADVSFPINFSVEYDPSIITQERIDSHKSRAIASGHTLIGPHKDDVLVFLDSGASWKGTKKKSKKTMKLNMATYGSRGQQRLAVLWLKFCELEFLKKHSDKQTVLLLDDILSELDDESRSLALSVLKDYQAVVTTTEDSVVSEIKEVSEDVKVISLQ
jgi:DNA replication and repair protein RecF